MTSSEHKRLLVALHGFEDDPDELRRALRAVVDEDSWSISCPRAPHEAPDGPTWVIDVDGAADADAATDSAVLAIDQVVAAVDSDARRGAILGGFSQGGAVALAAALAPGAPLDLGAVFCLGGYLLSPDDVPYDWDKAADLDVAIVHGIDDDVVPIQQARGAARQLERRGARVDFVEVPCGHEQAPLIDQLSDWLDQMGNDDS